MEVASYVSQSMVSFWDWDATFTGVRYAKLHLHILYWACFNQSSRRRGYFGQGVFIILLTHFDSTPVLHSSLADVHPQVLVCPELNLQLARVAVCLNFCFCSPFWSCLSRCLVYYFRTILWVQTGSKILDSLSHSLYSHSDTCSVGACTCRQQDWKKIPTNMTLLTAYDMVPTPSPPVNP